MKKLINCLLIAVALAGCGKTIDYSNDFSTATFINASPGSMALSVLVDSINQTGTALVYRGASLPLNISPGNRDILLRSANPLVPGGFLYPVLLPAQSFTTNTAYTYFNYDTLANSAGSFKVIRLTDDLTPAPAGFIKVRYIPLAVKAVTSDITFVRTSVTPADSVTITNQSYIGANPGVAQIEALSRFIQLPAGTYSIRQKIAGTQTLMLNPVAFPTVFGGVSKGTFTVYSTGGASNFPLEVRIVRHFP